MGSLPVAVRHNVQQQRPIDDNSVLRKMFDYHNNGLHIKCTFETVRNRYQALMTELYNQNAMVTQQIKTHQASQNVG